MEIFPVSFPFLKRVRVEEKRYGAIKMIEPRFTSFSMTFERGLGVKLVLNNACCRGRLTMECSSDLFHRFISV